MPPPSLVLPDIAGLPAVECCCPRRLHCEGCGAVSFVLCWHPEMADRIGLSLVRFLFCFFGGLGWCLLARKKQKQNLTNTKGHRHSLRKHNVRVTTRLTQFHCTTLSNHLGPREDPPRITRTEMHRFFGSLPLHHWGTIRDDHTEHTSTTNDLPLGCTSIRMWFGCLWLHLRTP